MRRTMLAELSRHWIVMAAYAAMSACSSDADPVQNTADSGAGDGGDGGQIIQTGTRIRIDTGEIQGDTDGATRRFRGIPFAAPPVGALRWKPPQAVTPWTDVRDTTSYSAKCPQLESLTAGAGSENEDCLYLNVWAPEPAPQKKLPVLVWLHGGGNTTGSASDLIPLGVGGHIFDGRGLTENQKVVIVTTNYRLGALGFFSHAALSAEDSRGVSGNQGLLDQRMAFDWVRRNITAFGGDPDNVTIFGESAGSVDVCLHVLSPGSRGLFHRAISQSGGCTLFGRSRALAETEMVKFAEANGCTDPATVLECMRALPVSTLLAPIPNDGAQPKLPGGSPYAGGTPAWSFSVTVDGDFVRDQPRKVIEASDFAKIPYILGSNTDEGTIFHVGEPRVTNEEEYVAALRRRYGDDATEIAKVYPVSDFANPQEALMRVTGDASLVCGTLDTARRMAAAGVPVHLYNFDRPIPIPLLAGFNLRATHGAEIAYIFGTLPVDTPPEDVALGQLMQGYWARHAATGEPNGAGAPDWPAFQRDADVRLNFNLTPSLVTDFRRTVCEFWSTRYDRAFQ